MKMMFTKLLHYSKLNIMIFLDSNGMFIRKSIEHNTRNPGQKSGKKHGRVVKEAFSATYVIICNSYIYIFNNFCGVFTIGQKKECYI